MGGAKRVKELQYLEICFNQKVATSQQKNGAHLDSSSSHLPIARAHVKYQVAILLHGLLSPTSPPSKTPRTCQTNGRPPRPLQRCSSPFISLIGHPTASRSAHAQPSPFQHPWDAIAHGHPTTAMYKMSTPALLPPRTPPLSNVPLCISRAHMAGKRPKPLRCLVRVALRRSCLRTVQH